jgi:hypothetical protein
VASDDIPSDRVGKPAQIFVEGGRCVVAPLPGGI